MWHLRLFFTGATVHPLELVSFVGYTYIGHGTSTVLGAFVNFTEGKVLPVFLMQGSVNVGPFIWTDGGLLAGSTLIPILAGSGL